MSDYEVEDYNENDYVDYDDYDVPHDENEINFEDMYLVACNENKEEDYKNLITMEKENSNTRNFSFGCYQKLCILYIQKKNLDAFSDSFKNLSELYSQVEPNFKSDTMREINQEMNNIHDVEFLAELCRLIIDYLFEKIKDKLIARELLNTGILFSKNCLLTGKIEMFGDLLEEMFDIMDRIEDMNTDESLKNSKLEFLVLKIQYCNIKNRTNEAKKLYFEADSINKEKVIVDNSLSSIINEQGGKIYMGQKNYERSLEKFKQAFYNYQDSGNNEKAKVLLKYSILNSIIVRNSNNVVSIDEIKIYLEDPQISALVELKKAYESANISLINDLWNNKIKKIETDEFIIIQLNEILHEIRFNYIRMKLTAYNVCKFSTLEKELGVDREYIQSLLLEIAITEQQESIKIDFTNHSVHYIENTQMKNEVYSNMERWINKLNNQ